MSRCKVVVVTASEMTIKAFLLNHIKALCVDYDVTVIVNTPDPSFLTNLGISASLIQVDIQRKINFYKDIFVLFKLISIFRSNKFHLIYSVTPKAGFLSVLAGFFTARRCRVHTFTGQVWATKTGLSLFILKLVDKIIAKLATHVLSDSESQKEYLIEQHVVDENKINVLASGSISGVDINRFKPDRKSRQNTRKELLINSSDTVILFLGRLSVDKGVMDLIDAFIMLVKNDRPVKLLIVGPGASEGSQLY